MIFRDRADAGARLAQELVRHVRRDRPLVVLGIPRGGVPVAAPVARALGAELGVVVARKIGARLDPELALGATTADGATYLDEQAIELTFSEPAWIEAERGRQVREARRRESLFAARRPALRDKDVIVVDDGIATGSTAIAALRSIRAAGASRVTLAVPVGAPSTIERVASEADEVVCLYRDPGFMALSAYYDDFAQTTDAEVQELLAAAAARPGPVAAPERP